MPHEQNPFANARVEHICLPSTRPKLTAEFLVKLGGEIIKEIPDGPIFCLFAGQVFELNYAGDDGIPAGSTCHIAVPFPSPEKYTEAVAWMKEVCTPEDNISIQVEHESLGLMYALIVGPGAVTFQLIWRAKPLWRPQESPPGGDNPEC